VRVVRATAGDPELRTWPVLFLAVEEKGLRAIEQIAKSLALHSRELRFHWFLEVEFQERLLFLLQPRVFGSPGEVRGTDVEAARADLATLNRLVERDMGLSWWHK
jgi:hypothetical protein